MPRLTDQQYLHQRQDLRTHWFEQGARGFAYLSFMQQHDLHDYFAPTKDFGDNQALEHRAEMSAAFPSLPQTAGRAYKEITPHLHPITPVAFTPGRQIPKGERRIVVGAIVRPEPDLQKLARALVALMEADMKKEREARDEPSNTAK